MAYATGTTDLYKNFSGNVIPNGVVCYSFWCEINGVLGPVFCTWCWCWRWAVHCPPFSLSPAAPMSWLQDTATWRSYGGMFPFILLVECTDEGTGAGLWWEKGLSLSCHGKIKSLVVNDDDKKYKLNVMILLCMRGSREGTRRRRRRKWASKHVTGNKAYDMETETEGISELHMMMMIIIIINVSRRILSLSPLK